MASPRLSDLTEAQWQRIVTDTAQLGGWAVYHTHDSRRSPRGFPDLALARPPYLVTAELKTDARASRPTPEQRDWLTVLAACSEHHAYLWRPADWLGVQALLLRRRLDLLAPWGAS